MMKPVHGQALIQAFEQWVPKSLAMDGDKIGLQIGTLNKLIKKVMITLDVLEDVVDEAIEYEIDLIFAHHAVIFHPLKTMRTDEGQSKIIAKCLKHDIAVYVAHTNLDNADGGMNDWLANALQLKDVEILVPHEDAVYDIHTLQDKGKAYGLGRIGNLATEQSLRTFAEQVKQVFELDGVRVIGDLQRKVNKVAVLGGDGNSFYKRAVAKGADVLVTGDIYYHTGHEALLDGLAMVDAGHYIEQIMKKEVGDFFKAFLMEHRYGTDVLLSQVNTNPFTFL